MFAGAGRNFEEEVIVKQEVVGNEFKELVLFVKCIN